mmetsp:Transcript_4968/g.12161  ORF Transcript_4968/g.12161 Transcript_4968/m.12161 type:complete len:270 (-) Transcript_4968:424-1233(-)
MARGVGVGVAIVISIVIARRKVKPGFSPLKVLVEVDQKGQVAPGGSRLVPFVGFSVLREVPGRPRSVDVGAVHASLPVPEKPPPSVDPAQFGSRGLVLVVAVVLVLVLVLVAVVVARLAPHRCREVLPHPVVHERVDGILHQPLARVDPRRLWQRGGMVRPVPEQRGGLHQPPALGRVQDPLQDKGVLDKRDGVLAHAHAQAHGGGGDRERQDGSGPGGGVQEQVVVIGRGAFRRLLAIDDAGGQVGQRLVRRSIVVGSGLGGGRRRRR